MLRLQDYVAFRGIAVLELVFMKAKLAAEKPEKQIGLMKALIESEWVLSRRVSWFPVCYSLLEANFLVLEIGN